MAHPASNSIGTGFFPREVKMTAHLYHPALQPHCHYVIITQHRKLKKYRIGVSSSGITFIPTSAKTGKFYMRSMVCVMDQVKSEVKLSLYTL